ncbi:aminodeoxychorismate synthase component I [Blochmannia endosymbiont of Camponotus modoc]|uniref:aminodeoxychorismate synthase component I n=1 Tax=Blochmannia endosymbiont of Camponotus modoc TaxID=2945587 RepID=UPI002024B7AC|nr:aminodeoxychorismate synthase component I [Blochmannia endosymbiont of Camponotus modoc]URJ29580.1 aminodeoxychorismate synthase component I [Blochmannia endosymbiont of Camponotus modoc]
MGMHLIELPYHPYTILNLFDPLSNTPWSMLLYSGHNNKHPDSRFDILVTDPTLTLITHNNITTISDNKNHQIDNTDPFILLKKYTHIMSMKPENNCQLPFQGGFLGVFGYDLARYIESLPKLAEQDLSFPDMAIGLYRWAIIADHKLCKNYLVTHDNPNQILTWVYKQQHIYKKNHVSNASFNLVQPWQSNISRAEYAQKFHTIQKHIISGNCYQVCLSQRFSAPYIGDEWIAFRYLLHYNHAPFSAFIRLPNKLSILSLSPERFLKLHNTKIKTQPIKGTLPRLKNAQDDYHQIIKLSKSTKNQSENLMIVDLLRNDIGRVAVPGSIHVSKLFDIQSFPGVHHMISTITGELSNNFSACDLLRACFPGGSIIGAPKVQVMQLIEQLEPQRRHVWSGSIGYLSCCGNMDTNIAIRTMLAERQYLFCSVGSGIIFESDEEVEYQEMQDKISTLLLPLLKKFYLK